MDLHQSTRREAHMASRYASHKHGVHFQSRAPLQCRTSRWRGTCGFVACIVYGPSCPCSSSRNLGRACNSSDTRAPDPGRQSPRIESLEKRVCPSDADVTVGAKGG